MSVAVQGLPFPGEGSEMELDGLPFQGSVRVGKKSMIMDTLVSGQLGRFFRRYDYPPEGKEDA